MAKKHKSNSRRRPSQPSGGGGVSVTLIPQRGVPLPGPMLIEAKKLTTVISACPHNDTDMVHAVGQLVMNVFKQLDDPQVQQAVGAESETIPASIGYLGKLISNPLNRLPDEVQYGTTIRFLALFVSLIRDHDANLSKCLDMGLVPVVKSVVEATTRAAIQTSFEGLRLLTLQSALSLVGEMCVPKKRSCSPMILFRARTAIMRAGFLDALVELLESPHEFSSELWMVALRVTEELSSNTHGFGIFVGALMGAPSPIPKSLSPAISRAIIKLGDFSESTISGSAEDRLAAAGSAARALLSLSQSPRPAKHNEWLFASSAVPQNSSGAPPIPMWHKLLLFLRHAKQPAVQVFEDGNEVSDEAWSQVKSNAKDALVLATSEAGFEENVKNPILEVLTAWMKEKVVVEDPDLMTAIGPVLANLALSDVTNQTLVDKFKVIEPLVAVFRAWAPMSVPMDDSLRPGILQQHRQVDVLKAWIAFPANLCCFSTSRPSMGESGILQLVLECLKLELKADDEMMITRALILLQEVCKGNGSDNVGRLLKEKQSRRILEFSQRHEPLDFFMESGRLLTIWVNSNVDVTDKSHMIEAHEIIDAIVGFIHMATHVEASWLVLEAFLSLCLLALNRSLVLPMCMSLVQERVSSTPIASNSRAHIEEIKHVSGLDVIMDYWVSPKGKDETAKQLHKHATLLLKTILNALFALPPQSEDNQKVINKIRAAVTTKVGRLHMNTKDQGISELAEACKGLSV